MIELDKEYLGVKKIIYNKLDECDLYVLEDDETFLLFFFNGKVSYFKIMPIFSGRWECEEAIYSPIGLYGFILESENINTKIKQKLEELKENVKKL